MWAARSLLAACTVALVTATPHDAINIRGSSHGRAAGAEEELQPIRYYGYAEMLERMQQLAAAAPSIVELWNAQDKYGIPSPGDCGDMPCKHWVMRLTVNGSAPTDANGAPLSPEEQAAAVRRSLAAHEYVERPHVLLSGNLHGDEKVGPMTLIYLAEMLVRAAQRAGLTGPQAASAAAADAQLPWLAHLLRHRQLIIIPMTNPWGYHRGRRDEAGDDPNRDFPYLQRPADCMRTAAARAVNELYREHLVQAGITFHGGMQAIAYEWGAPNRAGHDSESPDDAAQRWISVAMREAAGSFQQSKYPVDRMNKIVYPVRGGMEDWAYAGSWDTAAVVPCSPGTHGGYPTAKTRYNNAVLRAFNILVEAADAKTPSEQSLGQWADGAALVVEGPGDGHVPRNVRLALALADLAAPYLVVTKRLTGAAALPAAWLPWYASSLAGRRRAVEAAAGQGQVGEEAEEEKQEEGEGQGSRQLRLAASDYAGPGPCIQAAGASGASACSVHAAAYSTWQQLALPTGASSSSSVLATWLGWDVGGAIAVDRTGTLAGAWDPRLPPSLLTERWAGEEVDEEGAADPSPEQNPESHAVSRAFVTMLVQRYGLPLAEAEAASRYILTWQLFLLGVLSPEAFPDRLLAWRGGVASGATRWVFAEAGAQPSAAPPAPGNLAQAVAEAAASARTAAMQGLNGEPGAQLRGGSKRSGHVEGAPALNDPSIAGASSGSSSGADGYADGFTTRFSDCLLFPPPSPRRAASALRAAAAAGSSYAGPLWRPVVGGCASPPTASGSGRALADAAPGESEEAEDAAAALRALGASTEEGAARAMELVQSFLLVPYAEVDLAWRQQGAGGVEPAGTPPQSHVVNARFNPSWRFRSGSWRVRGRRHVVGEPVFVGSTWALPADAAAALPSAGAAGAGNKNNDAEGSAPSSGAYAAAEPSPVHLAIGSAIVPGLGVPVSWLVAYAAMLTAAVGVWAGLAGLRTLCAARRRASRAGVPGSGATPDTRVAGKRQMARGAGAGRRVRLSDDVPAAAPTAAAGGRAGPSKGRAHAQGSQQDDDELELQEAELTLGPEPEPDSGERAPLAAV